MKTQRADFLTTILGILIVIWVLTMYTFSLIKPDMEFPLTYVAGFIAVGIFLIWFKGDSARAFFEKIINRKVPPKQ